MDESTLPNSIQEALITRTAGASGVARLVIDGLLEMSHDQELLAQAGTWLSRRLPGYAPMWHIANAARGDQPIDALRAIRLELDRSIEKSVEAAVAWLSSYPGPVESAPSSSIVSQVLARLGGRATGGPACVAVAGADAIGPTTVLNIQGTRPLAARLPTVVVTTSLKLVPEAVFSTLGTPSFERIPLTEFAGVVLDGEVLDHAEVGRRAAAVRG
ncbi:hypothetical protein AB0B25_10640 [Nocardia sp. NPDC049190]|uniref:hypothetical protein n=1 Tax=Nocardia sp. NPDC049190 TaxID=3155650 RepID=UPI0033D64C22